MGSGFQSGYNLEIYYNSEANLRLQRPRVRGADRTAWVARTRQWQAVPGISVQGSIRTFVLMFYELKCESVEGDCKVEEGNRVRWIMEILQKNADGTFNFDHEHTVDILTGEEVLSADDVICFFCAQHSNPIKMERSNSKSSFWFPVNRGVVLGFKHISNF